MGVRKGSMEVLKQMQDKAQAQVQVLTSVLQDKAHLQMQATIQAISERVDIAKRGKQLLSDGGDFAEKALLAKKASIDAAACESEFAKRVRLTSASYAISCAAFRDSDAGLCNVQANPHCLHHAEIAKLAEAHEERAQLYATLEACLDRQIEAPVLSDPEWDALFLVQAQERRKSAVLQASRSAEYGLQVAQDNVSWAADALKTWASGSTSPAAARGSARLTKNPCC